MENKPSDYHEAFLLTIEAIAYAILDIPEGKPESEIARDMFAKISTTAFSSLYKKGLMRMDAEKPRSQRGT